MHNFDHWYGPYLRNFFNPSEASQTVCLKWSIDVIPIHCDCNVIALQTWRLGTGTQGPQTRVRRRSRPSSVFSGRGSSGRGFRFSAGTPGTIMVHGTNFIVRSPKIVFICKGPNHLYGKFLVDLSEEELICQDQHSRNVNGWSCDFTSCYILSYLKYFYIFFMFCK